MCGLIFCADPMMWPSLVAANMARAGRNKGALTFTAYEQSYGYVDMIDTIRVVPPRDQYDFGKAGIVHLQAPTSPHSCPHPATANGPKGDTLVWHNGLFQPSGIKDMQSVLPGQPQSQWDTELIAGAVAQGFDSPAFAKLGEIAGSFAVIAWRSGRLWAFRNSIAPLFSDPMGVTLSSVNTTACSEMLWPGVVHVLDDDRNTWMDSGFTFSTAHNPYGI